MLPVSLNVIVGHLVRSPDSECLNSMQIYDLFEFLFTYWPILEEI
jgi:hypothetical protein